jgi:hypothetical protein
MAYLDQGRPKEARQVKSKIKTMFFIFFDIKEIVHQEFVLAGQTVPHTVVTFYGNCMNMCEDFAQNFGNKQTRTCWLLHHDNAPSHTSIPPGNF